MKFSIAFVVYMIDLNGHTLTVDGKTYATGSKSTGDAIEIKISEGGGADMAPPDGKGKPDMEDEARGDGQMKPPSEGERPERPDGEPPAKPDGEPPEKPDGMGAPPDGNPPAKPD